ncbi:unnamed protein product [Nyctereutes procyonoides]|uniref:(raccoon dog) hypothetical protein n=1 Tax=Nyctereutes procyonoides TaxID=34880 RepID=A0A811ZSD9_NYCPR|nr:unnamed protein product [Nyctereutes procyonoides]
MQHIENYRFLNRYLIFSFFFTIPASIGKRKIHFYLLFQKNTKYHLDQHILLWQYPQTSCFPYKFQNKLPCVYKSLEGFNSNCVKPINLGTTDVFTLTSRGIVKLQWVAENFLGVDSWQKWQRQFEQTSLEPRDQKTEVGRGKADFPPKSPTTRQVSGAAGSACSLNPFQLQHEWGDLLSTSCPYLRPWSLQTYEGNTEDSSPTVPYTVHSVTTELWWTSSDIKILLHFPNTEFDFFSLKYCLCFLKSDSWDTRVAQSVKHLPLALVMIPGAPLSAHHSVTPTPCPPRFPPPLVHFPDSLSDMSFANIFSHSVGCLLVLLTVFFCCAEAFYPDYVPIIHFRFCFPCLHRCILQAVAAAKLKKLLVFSSRILMDSCLTFRSFIHFEVIFVYVVRICLIGDCVGGILAFDSDTDLLSPGTLVNVAHGASGSGGVESSRHLSRSNIDIPRSNGVKDSKRQWPRMRSDSSTYELDTIQQHQAFLSSLHASVLRNEPSSRRSSSSTMLDGSGAVGKFDFEIADLFLFGCPLGLVLALKSVIPALDVFQLRAACQQVYNLFHPADPLASRLEPLLEWRFHALLPFSVPRYQRYPLGDGYSTLLAEALQTNNTVFQEHVAPSSPSAAPTTRGFCRASEISIASHVLGMAESYTASSIAQIAAKWWGQKQIDYALYCPDALTAFPTVALPHLFHTSYWESTDVVSFLLRQLDGKKFSVFTPSKPREKWQRKRTHVKLRNVTTNHWINDAVANEDGPQVLMGRFMYGPLDMVTLTGEKVDVHIMMQPPSGEWLYLDTLVTNSSRWVSYTIYEPHRRVGDHTFADSYIIVLPKGMEFMVFSADGSFAASVSIMGSDPKVQARAMDVVWHWQDLGYLIIYVTGWPDMQKQRVVAWLAQHSFPHGVVSFCDGLVHDPLWHKANFLKLLISELHLRVHTAYGSTKDVAVYSSISLSPMPIYIMGRPTKKLQQQCQFITDGYAAHLAQLKYNHRARPARNAATRMALWKGSFSLPGQGDFLSSRNHLLCTISASPSQADGEQQGQRSMSVAAGCWGRTMASRLEPGTAAGPK